MSSATQQSNMWKTDPDAVVDSAVERTADNTRIKAEEDDEAPLTAAKSVNSGRINLKTLLGWVGEYSTSNMSTQPDSLGAAQTNAEGAADAHNTTAPVDNSLRAYINRRHLEHRRMANAAPTPPREPEIQRITGRTKRYICFRRDAEGKVVGCYTRERYMLTLHRSRNP